MATRKKNWTRFKVGRPSQSKDGFNPDCVPFDRVYHYTHLESAYTALREGNLRSGLVYDNSRLNTERIWVTWLSPNDWENAGGFRYGNVGFGFNMRTLVKGKRIYWVESVPYEIPALRILVTSSDHESELEIYDPTKGDGPWWYDKSHKIHYRNGHYCLEVMLESDLSLEDCSGVTIGSHSNQWCCVNRNNPRSCADFGLRRNKGGAYFLSRVVGTGLETDVLRFTRLNASGNRVPADELEFAYSTLSNGIMNHVDFGGDLESTDPQATSVAQAILTAYSFRQDEQRRRLASLFSSKDEMLMSCRAVVASAFHLTKPESLDDN